MKFKVQRLGSSSQRGSSVSLRSITTNRNRAKGNYGPNPEANWVGIGAGKGSYRNPLPGYSNQPYSFISFNNLSKFSPSVRGKSFVINHTSGQVSEVAGTFRPAQLVTAGRLTQDLYDYSRELQNRPRAVTEREVANRISRFLNGR